MDRTTTQTHASVCYRQRCSRCPAVFECKAQNDWPALSRLIYEHWKICPGNLHWPSPPPPAQTILNPPSAPRPSKTILNRPSSPRSSTKRQSAPRSSTKRLRVGGNRKNKKKDERKQELDDDEYACEVKAKSVKCRACRKVYKLDKRSDYYPALWVKHRDKCEVIKKMKLAKAEEAFCPPDDGDSMSTSDEESDYSSWEGGEGPSGYRDATEKKNLQRYQT